MKISEMKIIVTTLLLFCLAGCASSMSGTSYSRDQARQVQTVQQGTVIHVQQVHIEGTKSPVGAIAGGFMGYALGNTIGSGSGKTIARTAGALGGAAAGAGIEEKATSQMGLEITIELDNENVISVVQGAEEHFDTGDRVRVLRNPDGTARVVQ